MKKYTTLKKELLLDKDVQAEYNRLAPQFALASQIITMRKRRGFSQEELANRAGTKQSAIARLESGNYNPTVLFLEKIAHALEVPFTLSFGKK